MLCQTMKVRNAGEDMPGYECPDAHRNEEESPYPRAVISVTNRAKLAIERIGTPSVPALQRLAAIIQC